MKQTNISRVMLAGVLVVMGVSSQVAGPSATRGYAASAPSVSATYPTDGVATGIAFADLLRNGRQDAVVSVTGNGGGVDVYLTHADGTFAPPVFYATGAGSRSPSIGDVNNDGKLDIATANRTANTITVLYGNGDGTFQAAQVADTGPAPDAVAVSTHGAAAGSLTVAGHIDTILSPAARIFSVTPNSDGTFTRSAVAYIGQSGFVTTNCCLLLADLGALGPFAIVATDALVGQRDATVESFRRNVNGSYMDYGLSAYAFGETAIATATFGTATDPYLVLAQSATDGYNAQIVIQANDTMFGFGNDQFVYAAPSAQFVGVAAAHVVTNPHVGGAAEDIAVGDATGVVTLLAPTAGLTFTVIDTASVGLPISGLGAADLAGSGYASIVTLGAAGGLQVLMRSDFTMPATPTPTATSTSTASPTATALPTNTATSTGTATATTVPTATATVTPLPSLTPGQGSGSLLVTASVDPGSNLYYGGDVISLTTSGSTTALQVSITVDRSVGVSFSGAYTTFPVPVRVKHHLRGSTIVYTFTLPADRSLPAGSYIVAAQFSGSGEPRNYALDTYAVQATVGGQVQATSGHFPVVAALLPPSPAVRVVASVPSGANAYYHEEDLTLSTAASLTALRVTITMQTNGGLVYLGQWSSLPVGLTGGPVFGPGTLSSTFTLPPGAHVLSGSGYVLAAQALSGGFPHLTSGDTYSVTSTSGGVTSTVTGHF